MKKPYFIFIFMMILTVPLVNVFGASYCLFDKENSQLLLMTQNDMQFSGKIYIGKKPDQIIPTDDPNRWLAIYTPEAPKKDATIIYTKGELTLFNSSTAKIETMVELGYAPFTWVYTKDHKHLYISYKPTPESNSLELMHYDILQRKIEKIPDFANQIDSLCLSYDQTKLFALVPGEKTAKTHGKILILTISPLTLSNTLETTLNPKGLVNLDAQRIVFMDVDEKNKKQPGKIKIVNSSDFSAIEEYKFSLPYKISSTWYPDDQTYVISCKSDDESTIYKVTTERVQKYKHDGLIYRYLNYKDQLFLMAEDSILVIKNDTRVSCDTGGNEYRPSSFERKTYFYEMKYVPEKNIMIFLGKEGGMVKIIDLNKNKTIIDCSYGRSGVKFGHFMANFFANAIFTMPQVGPVNSTNFFKEGSSAIVDLQTDRYFLLKVSTNDVTVYDGSFKKPSYVIPDQSALTMFQVNQLNPQIWLVTDEKIYLLKPGDLSLKPIYDFKKEIKNCVLFEEEQKIVVLTNQETVVLDPKSLESKDSVLLYGNPDEKYAHLKKGEQRYYFIPVL